MIRKRVLIPLLALAAAVAIATTAGADQPAAKDKDGSAVMKDIKDGKARKDKTWTNYTGVWDGCRFHYLKDKVTTYYLEGSVQADVHEDAEPLPPKDKGCVTERNPTRAEMDEMEARVAKLNPYTPAPGAPPAPPLPPDRYRGTP